MFEFRESEKEFFKKNELTNFDITFVEESLNEHTVESLDPDLCDKVQIISIFINSEITPHVLARFKNLRVLTTRSTGTDHINLRACQKRNIAVINVERYGSTSVAQYTIGLIIGLVRKIPVAASYIHQEEKTCREFVGRDLSKMTIGIVGTGATGAAVAKVCDALNMKVFGFDPIRKNELKIEYTTFDNLITNSDIVSLHVPYTGDNLHMFSKREFDLMKPGSYLINTSRGELVNTGDLYKALETGHIKGAALDVLPCESYSFECNKLLQNLKEPSFTCIKEVETIRKLAKVENVIITPHIAYETQDSINYILDKTFISLTYFINSNNPNRVV